MKFINWLALLFVATKVFIGYLAASAETNHVPQFDGEIYIISIYEESPIGTYLMKAIATDANGDVIEYAIADDPEGYVTINNKTGFITTAKIIDKEKITADYIKFKIIAMEQKRPSQQSTQDVNLIVLNINDNEPIFTKKNYAVEMIENTPVDSFVARVVATDKDGDELYYKIVGGNENGFFKIVWSTGQVRTAKILDYEQKKEFFLRIQVTDGRRKGEGHNKTTNLFITVVDQDDNGAMFVKNYTAEVFEGYHKEAIIAQVNAKDQDKGINSPVRYDIEPSSNIDNVFSINKDGKVYVNGLIDREKSSSYNLVILATETNSQVRRSPARTTLKITVLDKNDNPPSFDRPEYIIHVIEHAKIGTHILNVTAHDLDEGKNAEFSYVLGETSDVFQITQFGEIFVNADLDRETKYVYQFKVYATQTPFLHNAFADVTVIIDDKNDHSPVFVKTEYIATVEENSEVGVYVTRVFANDRDKGKHAELTFGITPDADGNSQFFNIDPKSGIIQTTRKLDREIKSDYSLLIEATDGGKLENRRVARTRVRVYVKDRNDNSPVFRQAEMFKTIHYDEEINTLIIKLQAQDIDKDLYGRVSYRIISGNELNRFYIDTTTGELKVGGALARYPGQQFKLFIEAYDNMGNYPSRTSIINAETTITIDKKGANSVVLVIRSKIGNVLKNEDKILSNLKKILDIGVTTDKIERGDTPESTKFIFHGYNDNTFDIVKKEKIVNLLDSSAGNKIEIFRNSWNVTRWYVESEKLQDLKESSSQHQWHPIIYAVLGFSGLIAIFGMIGIIYLIKSKRRNYDDSGASQTSSRVPIHSSRKPRDFWMTDDLFESVSQVGTSESYVQASGFLSRSCDRYELDPSNLYGKNSHEEDPFQNLEDRPPSRGSPGSRASSIFAASSVMTVCRAPHRGDISGYTNRGSLPRTHKLHASNSLSTEKKLSVILDDDGKTKSILQLPERSERPPSYEYNFDDKIPDKFDA